MRKLRSIGALLLPLCMLTSNATGGVLFQDDFEDGVIDPFVYIPIGNAILFESGGVLNIQTFGPGDGMEIVMPAGAACVELKQTVLQDGFDRGEAQDPVADEPRPGARHYYCYYYYYYYYDYYYYSTTTTTILLQNYYYYYADYYYY